ncbi:MAG: class D sortase [Patescibacteria group bacterium]
MKVKITENKLRWINNGLAALIIALCLYVIALPLLPQISFWWRKRNSQAISVPIHTQTNNISPAPAPKPTDTRLIIPSLGMNEVVYTDGSLASLNKGPGWRNKTAKPTDGGNTVIVGHRFTYSGASVFYHLDKVKSGEVLALFWDGKEFNYKVREIKVVPATAVEIESSTENDQLTLYTCTPIWSAKDRLVIIADEIYEQGDSRYE